jgi:hypothetical protein
VYEFIINTPVGKKNIVAFVKSGDEQHFELLNSDEVKLINVRKINNINDAPYYLATNGMSAYLAPTKQHQSSNQDYYDDLANQPM